MAGKEELVTAMNDIIMTELVSEMEPVAPEGSLGWELSYKDQPLPSVTTLYVSLMAYSSLLEYKYKGLAPINADSYLSLAYDRLQAQLQEVSTLRDKRHLTHLK
eukprot:Protomagalhaensia_wolfi_Nauph_80__3311@NODE_3369_length_815_cov_6_239691_g2645_i0_p1_GENE_NODE_3369_length_815_cov_6_239691_g2645_i0NODE_3369_length_815_cov_6_239691_g2645_i0_p1_ORF_typecomplete_len104_score2_53_NODE_3369_length_815_cov_6_239691_g2645_i0337648